MANQKRLKCSIFNPTPVESESENKNNTSNFDVLFFFHFLMIKDGYGTVVLKVDGWDGWLYLWDSVSVTGGGGI